MVDKHMYQDITIDELFEMQQSQPLTFIDVRSEKEFQDAALPGSLNIPLFTNEERHEIGLIYKQISKKAAMERGLTIVSAKLPEFVGKFEKLKSKKVVYCWRGGMRSKTTATVLSLMGIHVYRLFGGIRAYRTWVVQTLEAFEVMPKFVVINGYTGTGKTKILNKLSEQDYPVMDLEGMAQHRGSIFGQIGLTPNNQKTFESLLVHELIRLKKRSFILLEAESKRIGKAVLPEFISNAKQAGTVLMIEMPLEQRVKHIIEDYEPVKNKAVCLDAFMRIKKKIHTPIANQIHHYLLINDFEQAVSLLLKHYYDERYHHKMEQYDNQFTLIKARDIDEAVELIIMQLNCNNYS